MLTPNYYEGCADDIIELYEQLEDDIISDIVRRMMKTGVVTESAKHQAEMLQNAGLLYDDILSEIAKRTDATEQQVKALFEDAGVETVKFDNEIYHQNGLTPVDIRQSPAMRQTLEAGYRKTLGNMKNLTLTTANTSQTTYINACNQAYMQVTSGAFSYQEAIKKAVQKTAQDGAFVLYPSGHRDRVDVAVRRSVLTGVGQTCREIGIMNAEEAGCDLMEITAHSGARPEHAKWQGKLVSISGENAGRIIKGRKVLSKKQIGYGKGDGFGGWNCRHDWLPFFEDFSMPNYSDEQLKKLDEKNISYNGKKYSEYEISQIQRGIERDIRSSKREQVAYRTAVEECSDPELKPVLKSALDYSNEQVRKKQAKMRDFINQTKQDRDYFREQNYGKVIYTKNNGNPLTSAKKYDKINKEEQIKWLKKGADLTPEQKRELTAYAKGKNIVLTGLNKTDVDISLMKEMIDEAEKILKVYPELNNNPQLPFTIKMVNGMSANDFAMTTKSKDINIVQLNANAFRNKAKLAEEYQKLVDEGWFVEGTTYRSIIVHEMGHMYEHQNKTDVLSICKEILNAFENDEILFYVNKNLSKYSASYNDGSEIISEIFSSFYTGNPKDFERKFIKKLKG